jgi:hypothetical protein
MERMVRQANWGDQVFVLKSGEVAEKGHLACLDTATGQVVNGAAATGIVPLGIYRETLTGDGAKRVNIKLFDEIIAYWWDNDAGDPADATDLLKNCYVLDSGTVTMTSTGHSLAGLILAVDPVKGVLVYSPLSALLGA